MLLILFTIRTRLVVSLQILWPSQFTETWPRCLRVCRHFDKGFCRYPRTLYHWALVNSNCSYSPETPNLGQNWQVYVPCDFEIWQMTLKNNRASFLCYFKLCAPFCSPLRIQTGVMVQKSPNWDKFCFDLWPWPLPLTFCMDITCQW